jgi:hypothetical protein
VGTKPAELQLLDDKIDEQAHELEQWRKPSEPLLFETLRAIDVAYCEELFEGDEKPDLSVRRHRSLLTWGVNKALDRMLPDQLLTGPFKLFRSTDDTQQKADWFLLQCGVLERADLLRGLLAEGLLTARLDAPPEQSPLIRNILVLKTSHPSVLQPAIARTQRLWLSEFLRESDRPWESGLERRHLDILPELEKRVERFMGWSIAYSTTDEIDRYFLEWGQVYLRRMWSQDLIGAEEKIGGNQFNEYLGVLAALSARAQKHLCYAMILKHRHPELDLRNLLTTFVSYDELLVLLSRFLDADSLHVQKLLASLTLEPLNKATHVGSSRTAWAPVVRATYEHCLLPLYGLEINPFLFLLSDLQAKYPKDWFEAANNREKRWHAELKAIFRVRGWKTSEKNVALRDAERTATDIDFAVYDDISGQVMLVQLKWQQPVGVDTRARRSAAKNLIEEGNRWIAAVRGWLDRNGVDELSRRLGMKFKANPQVVILVLARYEALFPSLAKRDDSATWADWAHFLRVFSQSRPADPKQLVELLDQEAARIQASYSGESYAMPLGDLAIILNPISEPSRTAP